MRDFSGKVAVITGAADGIGRALADAFAAAGARLVLADVDGAKVEAAGRELAGRGAEVLTVPTDVSRRDQVLSLRDAAFDRFGAVHVLCNNAGVMGPVGDPLWELPIGEWERVMAVNLWGVLHGIQAFLPAMLAAGDEGHIVNTASMQGVTSGALIPEYAVSKHAVVALSEALRAQLTARAPAESPGHSSAAAKGPAQSGAAAKGPAYSGAAAESPGQSGAAAEGPGRSVGARIGVTVLCPGAVSTDLASREHRRLSAQDQPWAVAPGSGGQQRWGSALTPAEIAAAAIAAVRDNRFYVFTHPGSRTRVEARLRPILDALDALDAGEPDGPVGI